MIVRFTHTTVIIILLFGGMAHPARADNAATTNKAMIERLLIQYEQTKDKELLVTIEKITIATTEHEQKTAQNRDKYLFWLITVIISLVFCCACIVYGERQKRYKN